MKHFWGVRRTQPLDLFAKFSAGKTQICFAYSRGLDSKVEATIVVENRSVFVRHVTVRARAGLSVVIVARTSSTCMPNMFGEIGEFKPLRLERKLQRRINFRPSSTEKF